MCDNFVCRLAWVRGLLHETSRRDVSILQQRRKLGRDNLVGDPKWPTNADTDKAIERIGTPPKSSPHVSDELSPSLLPQLKFAQLLGDRVLAQFLLWVFP